MAKFEVVSPFVFSAGVWKSGLAAPAGSVRLLSFLACASHPMFLAIDSQFTQGATDIEGVAWDAASRRLSGTLRGVENTDYRLWALAPEGFALKEASASVGGATARAEGAVVRLEFHCDITGPVQWQFTF